MSWQHTPALWCSHHLLTVVLPWKLKEKKKIIISAAVQHWGILGKHYPWCQVCWIWGSFSTEHHFEHRSGSALPSPGLRWAGGCSISLSALKILPRACTELFRPAASETAQHSRFVHLGRHLTASRASRGFAGWCRDDQGGCGDPGFWLCHVRLNVNYLANGNKILTGRKSHWVSLGSTAHPPKNQLSCLRPGLSQIYGWSTGGFPMISWKDVGLPANSCVFSWANFTLCLLLSGLLQPRIN